MPPPQQFGKGVKNRRIIPGVSNDEDTNEVNVEKSTESENLQFAYYLDLIHEKINRIGDVLRGNTIKNWKSILK